MNLLNYDSLVLSIFNKKLVSENTTIINQSVIFNSDLVLNIDYEFILLKDSAYNIMIDDDNVPYNLTSKTVASKLIGKLNLNLNLNLNDINLYANEELELRNYLSHYDLYDSVTFSNNEL